jgi:cell shape-determining protein MreD
MLAFSLLGFVLLCILGPLHRLLGTEIAAIDLALVIVVYLATKTDDRSVLNSLRPAGAIDPAIVIAVLVIGYFCDLLGGGTKGLHAFSLSAVYLVGRLLSEHLYLSGVFPQIVVTFFAAIGSSLIVVLLRSITGSVPTVELMAMLAVQALVTGLFAPPMFRLLNWMDRRLAGQDNRRGTIRF